ncbi:MAG: hypothetical protein FWD17_07240, partial [Polyangiaceae bacterium]|nr:hypothetical protein [Polyangiaceae bacterium]
MTWVGGGFGERKGRRRNARSQVVCALVACATSGCADILGIGDWSNLRDSDDAAIAPNVAPGDGAKGEEMWPEADGAANIMTRDGPPSDATADAPSNDATLDASPNDATLEADAPLPDAGPGDAPAESEVDASDEVDASGEVDASDEMDASSEAEAGPSDGTITWALRAGTTGHTTPSGVAL